MARAGSEWSVTRIAGILAGVAGLAGAALLTWSVLATQGLWYSGYVSEVAVAGQPHTTAYRGALFVTAFALLALAVGLGPGRGVVRAAAVGLAVAGGLVAVSGSVPCSPDCPLPPYETPTAADIVHGGASIAAVGVVGLAILLLALPAARSSLRGLSRVVLVPLVPVGVVVTFALVALGRGYLLGFTERLALAIELVWMLLAALLLATRRVST
jgi:hypothetical protein